MPSAERAAQAKKIIAATKRKAAATMRDDAVNRSTRAQRAQRIKAEGFDQLAALH